MIMRQVHDDLRARKSETNRGAWHSANDPPFKVERTYNSDAVLHADFATFV